MMPGGFIRPAFSCNAMQSDQAIMTKKADNMPFVIEKARLNIWNLAGFVIGIAVTAFGWGITYNNVMSASAEARASIVKITEDIKDIRLQIPAIAQLQFQSSRMTDSIAENRTNIKAVNERVDRIVESFGAKLDAIIDNQNRVATKVEVLSAMMGTDKPNTKGNRP